MRTFQFVLIAALAIPFAAQAADDASSPGATPSATVTQCYERLQKRVPKRTAYTAIHATDEQLAAGMIERWEQAFTPRLSTVVSTRVLIDATGTRGGKSLPVILKCGLNGDKIVTWEIEQKRN
ncbi:hypothetical protein GCM10007860_25230 [Chitiniphilus shinanonensis]|uniref:Uncharacterized protein n=1 Tax=Chitiniphilus shinanonensis TaxID=553088 RepID=A0ABQ6BVJ1_9NEIS|nr:hypothetical protein [Chitiniphilus shinanonensis]GLS05371.1 hypothetical protein GCM10007860_25230 [Chitiniphilus shinanonensis]